MWDGHMSSTAWWIMTIGMVFAILAVVVVVLALGRSGRPSSRAENILSERFARGEIDEGEYRSRRDVVRE
jgi:putative membrane protein